tara:strand:- start:554 stop:1522 length:969 start_codon:yes stop_codon:yes gene_type:complete
MGFARPKSVDSKGEERGGGGGGATQNPWTSFQDLTDINTVGGWSTIDGSGVNSDTSLTMDGNVLVFNQAAPSNLFMQGATMQGKAIIRSKHLEMVTDAGLSQPSGVAAHLLQPEAVQFKLQVEFDTDNGGPINGTATGGTDAYGHKMTCIAGLVGYGSDQGGSPGNFGNTTVWMGAQVLKNSNLEPAASSSTSLYRVGYKTYYQNGGTVTGFTWKNQQSAPAAAHDALVFQLSSMRMAIASGNTKIDTYAGSYAIDQPWNPVGTNHQANGITDNSTRFYNAASQYWHPFVAFASTNASVQGVIRIKSIKMLLQPLVGRTGIT